jgi:hypothetical protein
MQASKGWDRSEGIEIDVVAIGETKAHLVMRNARRLRENSSLIEEATGFYAYTKEDGEWKMFAFSDILGGTIDDTGVSSVVRQSGFECMRENADQLAPDAALYERC